MDPGKLTTLVRVERLIQTRDTFGQAIETPSTLLTCWVSVTSSKGTKLFYARTLNPEVTHVLTTWWQPGVLPRDRIVLEESGRVLNIVAVINVDELNEILQLNCTEQV